MRPLSDIVQNFWSNDSPERFKRFYLLMVFSSLVLILALSFTVLSHQTRNNLIEDIGIHSEQTAVALLSSESTVIRTQDSYGSPTLSIDRDKLNYLDLNIRLFLQPFSIVKIKIYNTDKSIIYCTERSLIGRSDKNNPKLAKAFTGLRQTIIKGRQSLTDLSDEKLFGIEVAEVYVPIRNERNQIVGVFELYSDVSNLKSGFEKHLISSFATLSGALLLLSLASYIIIVRESADLRTAHQMLETLATVDALTGIYNRRQLLVRAGELFSMMRRSREKIPDGIGLGVIMIDIDHFKLINDTHGHMVGDNILHDVTRRIETVLRPYDVFGRYGGEEFLLFLPNTSSEEAKLVAVRVLNSGSEPYLLDELQLKVTVSIGCTWTNARDENLDTVLSRVDNLLYEAKQNGRNRIVYRH